MPFLSMTQAGVGDAQADETVSLSTQKRRYCRLGRKRRWFCCWRDTLFPNHRALPVTWQTRASDWCSNSSNSLEESPQ